MTTPPDESAPAGHDSPSRWRTQRWRWATPVVAGACGAMFVISAINSQGQDLRPGRYVVTVVAANAAGTSAPRRLALRVVRR